MFDYWFQEMCFIIDSVDRLFPFSFPNITSHFCGFGTNVGSQYLYINNMIECSQ